MKIAAAIKAVAMRSKFLPKNFATEPKISHLREHDYKIKHTTIQVEEVECEGTQCPQV